ncbi:glycosyltransferase family 2 protein [Deinococcus roseus]|nr:glycosyltransferase family 2 protein [Deinococcus roseus]
MTGNPAVLTLIIPAYNEEKHIARVVEAALASRLGRVLVVSDASSDQTADLARKAGAEVIELPQNLGKAGAMLTGARAATTEHLMFLDADLQGLTAEHLQRLAAPVLTGKAQATVGLFSGGRASTTLASWMTRHWSGQRVLPRDILLNLPHAEHLRYAIEVALTDALKEARMGITYVTLHGVSQVTKEEKQGLLSGAKARLRMFRQIFNYHLQKAKQG